MNRDQLKFEIVDCVIDIIVAITGFILTVLEIYNCIGIVAGWLIGRALGRLIADIYFIGKMDGSKNSEQQDSSNED